MPQHCILLTGSLVPEDAVRISAGIGYEEFGRIDQLIVCKGTETYAFDTFVDTFNVNSLSEYPVYLKFRIVFQDIFGKVAGIAAVLLEGICPTSHSSLLDAHKRSYNQ